MSFVSRCFRRLHLLVPLAFLVTMGGCERLPPPAESGELVVGVREAAGFFERTPEGYAGAEHDLVQGFANELGLRVRFVTANDPAGLAELLRKAKVHLALARPNADNEFLHSQPIRRSKQVVAGISDGLAPEDLSELAGREVQVIAGSPLAGVLRELPQPPVVLEVPDTDEAALLARVAESYNGLAAVHEIHLDLATNFHPDLRPLVRLPGEVALGWSFAGEGASALRAQADTYLAEMQRNGGLARIHDRYFGHINRITANNAAQFIEDIRNRLPDYRHDFQVAEELTGIDWRLLAALAYQESKWDPLATSYTNVRGMMMLTEDTADHLGVKNRLDPAESIRAGARYLQDLVEQIPSTTPMPDRLWLALAAYNLGMGHLRGGIVIGKSQQRDTDSWYEMKRVLPQLARPAIYSRLKSGRARGGEAVIMVENIRTYFDILARFEAPHATPFPRQPSNRLRLR